MTVANLQLLFSLLVTK